MGELDVELAPLSNSSETQKHRKFKIHVHTLPSFFTICLKAKRISNIKLKKDFINNNNKSSFTEHVSQSLSYIEAHPRQYLPGP